MRPTASDGAKRGGWTRADAFGSRPRASGRSGGETSAAWASRAAGDAKCGHYTWPRTAFSRTGRRVGRQVGAHRLAQDSAAAERASVVEAARKARAGGVQVARPFGFRSVAAGVDGAGRGGGVRDGDVRGRARRRAVVLLPCPAVALSPCRSVDLSICRAVDLTSRRSVEPSSYRTGALYGCPSLCRAARLPGSRSVGRQPKNPTTQPRDIAAGSVQPLNATHRR